jgi:hypothetical protein
MLLYQTRPSNSAHILRDALGIRRVGPDLTPVIRRRLTRNRDGRLLNWGNSTPPGWETDDESWLNHPQAVAVAVSKFRTLTELAAHDVDCVEVTREPQIAQQWHTEGRCLTRRDGLSSGQGIRHQYWEIADDQHFYAKLFPKTHEFRVHVFKETVIDFTEKKARQGVEVNRLIRSFDNGWVHAHDNLSVTPEDRETLEELAIEAVMVLGLDFGAVDMLATLTKDNPRRLKKARVCEVNTAPGLENTATIGAYVRAFAGVRA